MEPHVEQGASDHFVHMLFSTVQHYRLNIRKVLALHAPTGPAGRQA